MEGERKFYIFYSLMLFRTIRHMGSVPLLSQDGEGIQSWTLTFYERLPQDQLCVIFFPVDSLYRAVGFSRLRSGVRWSFRS